MTNESIYKIMETDSQKKRKKKKPLWLPKGKGERDKLGVWD